MTDIDTSKEASLGLNPQQQALLGALAHVLDPLAELCVGKGISIQALEESLRHAMVKAARMSCGGEGARVVSRISAMTGLTRREVTRISQAVTPSRPASRSLVTEIFTRWAFEAAYRDARGRPMSLPKAGPTPSFEALAKRVTQDVHPRTLLAEMQRLGMVKQDSESGLISLTKDSWVPQGNWTQMVAFLGDNVGDHLRAATSNVLAKDNAHFEQSVLADELSRESLERVKPLIEQQWQILMSRLVPELEALMADDKNNGRPADQAVRIGMFSWMRPMTDEEINNISNRPGEEQ